MSKHLKAGDKVAWNTSQGETHGDVVKTLTKPIRIKAHKVASSKASPEVLVKSAKSGDLAAHKPSALKRRP